MKQNMLSNSLIIFFQNIYVLLWIQNLEGLHWIYVLLKNGHTKMKENHMNVFQFKNSALIYTVNSYTHVEI